MSEFSPAHTILIVDDTSGNLALLFEHLQQEGYRVLVAESGESALETLQYTRPDLILLDLQMPGLDGFETIQRIKAQPELVNIPVIFLTVTDTPEEKVRAFTLGGMDYITKPIEPVEVLARVHTHLTLSRLQQHLESQNQWLEAQISLRTAAVQEANKALQTEIEHRKRHEQEKDKLFELVRQQNDHLRNLSNWLIDGQTKQRNELVDALQKQVEDNLQQANAQLDTLQDLLQDAPGLTGQVSQCIQQARNALHNTQSYLREVTTNLAQPSADGQSGEQQLALKLSAREQEVLQLTVTGKSSYETGDLLNLSDATVRTFRLRAEVGKLLGTRIEMVDLDRIRDIVPSLNLDGHARHPILAGLWHQDGGTGRHDAVAWGYAARAAEMGVELHQRTEVTGIEVAHGRVAAVETTRGRIAAGQVVQAVAGMSSVVAAMAGIRLPIRSYPLQAMVTEPLKPFLDPLVSSSALHVYVSQSARGEVVIGGGSDPYELYSTRSTLEMKESLAGHVLELFPFLSPVRLLRQWAGITDMTPDYSPVMGASPVENYWLDAGWGTWGFKATPVSGKRMAETVAAGRVPNILEPFRLDRFRSFALANEMGATAASH